MGAVDNTLGRMGRQKTISDDAVLGIARDVFRARGHNASTRAIAEAAGISEAILYQRFGSKNELFFRAMHATGPDVEDLLGPAAPPGNARTYLFRVVVRLGEYFADVIPLALRVMTHPSFDPQTLARVQPGGPAAIRQGLARRLASLAQRGQIGRTSVEAAAQLLVSLAHDWALGRVLLHGTRRRGTGDLQKMVDVVWRGLRKGATKA